MRKRMGGCNCGQVRLEVSGKPVRVGLCHCQVCRKETGSLGNFFAVWRADHVSTTGEPGAGCSRPTIATSVPYAGRLCLRPLMARMKLRFESARSMTPRRTSLPLMSCGCRDERDGSFRLRAPSSMKATGRSLARVSQCPARPSVRPRLKAFHSINA